MSPPYLTQNSTTTLIALFAARHLTVRDRQILKDDLCPRAHLIVYVSILSVNWNM